MFDGLVAFAVDRWRHDCGARRVRFISRPGSPMKEGRFVLGTFRSERMRVLYRSHQNDRLRVMLVLVHIDITPPQMSETAVGKRVWNVGVNWCGFGRVNVFWKRGLLDPGEYSQRGTESHVLEVGSLNCFGPKEMEFLRFVPSEPKQKSGIEDRLFLLEQTLEVLFFIWKRFPLTPKDVEKDGYLSMMLWNNSVKLKFITKHHNKQSISENYSKLQHNNLIRSCLNISTFILWVVWSLRRGVTYTPTIPAPRGAQDSRGPKARAMPIADEAHFWLNGYVNKQNCRIWSEANPQVYVETPLHPEKLTVWCALWAGGILLQKR
ncbi:hypothetical protein TNCV_2688411 [Trichonephila clavipes]|nr:hypothetical protein TNCV_2688411 [Trichonephila clavipes]